eukprot:1146431-Rhodomonas_salina.1
MASTFCALMSVPCAPISGRLSLREREARQGGAWRCTCGDRSVGTWPRERRAQSRGPRRQSGPHSTRPGETRCVRADVSAIPDNDAGYAAASNRGNSIPGPTRRNSIPGKCWTRQGGNSDSIAECTRVVIPPRASGHSP